MKTVLHLSSSSGPGGAERIVCVLASSLDRGKYRSLVGLFRPGWLKDQCESRGLVTYVLPSHGFMHWRWMRECYRLIRDEKVDLIHAHEFDANVHGMMVAALAGIPMVATVHGKNYVWEKMRRRLAYQAVARKCQLVAVSDDLKRFIVNTLSIPTSRVQVIYNGVEPSLPMTDAEIDRCRTELGLSANDFVIGTVGSLYPVKGHQFLLDAMPAVLRRYPNAMLLLVGRGELEVSLKEQAMRLGIEERVRFLGMRQDVPKLLAVMDVFVLPSLSEGLSMALLEAMGSGKPAIATRVGGNPELIEHGKSGFLVQAEDADDLAESMMRILSDEEMMQQFGRAGAERVRGHFGVNKMAVEYQKLYSNLIGSGRSRGNLK